MPETNMKTGSTLFEKKLTIEKAPISYEYYVDLTAKLIKRTYIATHKLVQDWPIEKIIQHYELCTKHAGNMPGDVKWWWLRKKEGKF